MRLSRPLFLPTGMLSYFTSTIHTSESANCSPDLDTTQQVGDPHQNSSFCYHNPPKGVLYSENPSVFGRILEGTLPSTAYDETDELYAFRDIQPRAKLHALVIPKAFVPSVKCLLGICSCIPFDSTNRLNNKTFPFHHAIESLNQKLALVHQMKQMALLILKREQMEAFEKRDYILCFHVPPFNSVDHLHLHVLAPASQMSLLRRYGKYRTGTPWCLDLDQLIQQLEDDKKE